MASVSSSSSAMHPRLRQAMGLLLWVVPAAALLLWGGALVLFVVSLAGRSQAQLAQMGFAVGVLALGGAAAYLTVPATLHAVCLRQLRQAGPLPPRVGWLLLCSIAALLWPLLLQLEFSPWPVVAFALSAGLPLALFLGMRHR